MLIPQKELTRPFITELYALSKKNLLTLDRMCQKTKVFKKFHAVIMSSSCMTSHRTLQVFKHYPSEKEIADAVKKYGYNKPEAVPFIYSEKPKIEVLPIHISPDILLN